MKTDLTIIPNVGKRTKESLQNIGITCVEDLIGQNPEELYMKDCIKKAFRLTNANCIFSEWLFTMLNTIHGKKKS